eukprot:TRINITY_DN14721_c0_g1_i1.p1 TRINITY_DN14721_c0_g1~~TRINITY_DN14721_c0_g1_i1.p1  ORF type:complete len:340 (-),score=64.15 TRINITY_DN14721_c0_g1_i1:3-1022(-)
MRAGVVVLVVAVFVCLSYAAVHNSRPVIGIITQPSTSDVTHGPQYFPASYVKWIESGGARVVPILYGYSDAELHKLFNSINGLMLPGGGGYFSFSSPFWIQLKKVWSMVLDANSRGDYFPVWGTCFGFQLLHLLASEDENLLLPFNSENYTVPLNFTNLANSSRLFGTSSSWISGKALITNEIYSILEHEPVTMNNHHYGVSPAEYSSNSRLGKFFNLLSTNVDRNGKTFVSSSECKLHFSGGNPRESYSYPIYATQWHPEKPQFEWDAYEVTDHSTDSITANSYTARFFVREARRSNHHFANQNELIHKYLIYNYNASYSGLHDPEFEQSYYFPHPQA